MVHGVGSCSGGGGFSGGSGMSTSTFIAISSHRRRRRHRSNVNTNNNEHFRKCFGFCCCQKNQSRRHRLAILWSWFILVALVTGLVTAFSVFGDHTIDASPTDMRKFQDGVHSTFCEGVEVKSDIPIDVYLMPGEPVVDLSRTTKYEIKKVTDISVDTYEYWGFYLLKGSTVKVTSCVEWSTDLFVIKGYDNFKNWKNDNDCTNCYWSKHVTTHCYNIVNESPDIFTFLFTETDEYFFIWSNGGGYFDTNVKVSFNLTKTFYNVSSAVQKCTSSKHCELSFSGIDSDESVVYFVPDVPYDEVYVTSSCARRQWLFVVIFMLIPLFVGTVVSIIIYLKCKDKGSKYFDPTSNTNHGLNTPISEGFVTNYSTLDNRNTQNSYSTLVAWPEVTSKPTEAPPPYEAMPPPYQQVGDKTCNA